MANSYASWSRCLSRPNCVCLSGETAVLKRWECSQHITFPSALLHCEAEHRVHVCACTHVAHVFLWDEFYSGTSVEKNECDEI